MTSRGGLRRLSALAALGAVAGFRPLPRPTPRGAAPLAALAEGQPQVSEVGAAALDWPNLGFQYRATNGHVKMVWKEDLGKWSAAEMVEEPTVTMHIGATALHYGQAVFEGLKAFAQPDGSVKIFRPQENAARLQRSCERIRMPWPSEAEFLEACQTVVSKNLAYVPPYGSGGALYLRPLLFGSGARIGLQPADEYTFLLMCTPVGDYYKGGMGSPVTALIMNEYDRAAPRGVGSVKVAGNYAADLLPNMKAKAEGYPVALYLDAETRTKVEEFSTSNFIGITNDDVFVTPDSPAVLPSITNKSLQSLALDMGLKVERRAIPVEELRQMKEAAACGTAVVITPVNKIVYGDETIEIGSGDEPGPIMTELYKRMRAIQSGDASDHNDWTWTV